MRIEVACLCCGAAMQRVQREIDRGRGRYCSRSCMGRARVHIMNAVRRSPKEYARPPVRHGPANNKWVPALVFDCQYCGTRFEKKPWRIRQGHTGEFCSFACKTAFWRERRAGENAPDWVGGPRTYRGRSWLRVRAVVVERQGGDCAHCGKHVGKSLPVHHLRPFRDFTTEAEANDPANLIGLCQSCHMKSEPRPRRTA